MLVSLSWLKQYVDVAESAAQVAHKLTMAGLEVGAIEMRGESVDDVVVAQIEEKGPHPDADKLSLCRVNDGTEVHDIVCGATNMVAGDKVALARVGSVLPGNFKIKKAKIRGVHSFGMMCSNRELNLADDHAGIIILPADAPLGEKLVDYLGLPDPVLEVEITPNRPDWLSVVGVAREYAALTGRELKLPKPEIKECDEIAADLTSVTIEAPELCHRYAARLIKGVKVGPSPLWMQSRLQAAGVRPISNVVDVTNYVLMELGHPLHAFDFNRLRGKRIVVKTAGEGEKFTTLDNEERTMNAQNLMIADAEGSVAVAGVMGGLNSEVEDDTTDVLLESAWFLPTSIRRTSKELGLKSEAAYRFERGTDIEGLLLALERATALIVELAGGQVCKGIIDAYPTVREDKEVSVRMSKTSSILGIEVSAGEAAGYLEGLGLTILENDGETLKTTVPPFRVDLEREIDLIEEIVRVKGYDSIPATMPRSEMDRGEMDDRALADRVRDALAASGLTETITYSFIDPDDDGRINLAEGSELREKVPIANPLGKETSVLRTTLLPGLLKTAGLNARRGNRDVRIFEVGRTFHPVKGEQLPEEVMRAGGLVTGQRTPTAWWNESEKVDFFDAKGILEAALASLGVQGARYTATTEVEWLQPGRAALVEVDGKQLGWIGEMLPELLDDYELTAPVAAFQIDVSVIDEAAKEVGTFPGLVRFPGSERDLALLVDKSVSSQQIIDAVESLGIRLLKKIALFDAFEGGKLPDGVQSLGFRFTYQSADRTLTEEEVAKAQDRVVNHLSENLGARLRDV